MTYTRFLAFLALSAALLTAAAQDTVETTSWIDYFSYQKGCSVGKVKDRVYCSSTNAIFYYNTSDNSLNRVSKVNLLSDVGITAMACSSSGKVTIVGYSNGNIDILQDDQGTNVVDLKSKQISSSKSVNDVTFIDGKALLATSFGLVLLDYSKGLFVDTYTFSDDDGYISVNKVYVDTLSLNIYAATGKGIYWAQYGGGNLADFGSWQKIEAMGDRSFNAVCYYSGQVIANVCSWVNPTMYDTLFVYKDGVCSLFPKQYYTVNNLRTLGGKLYIVNYCNIDIYNEDMYLKDVVDTSDVADPYFTDVTLDSDGSMWVSDANAGLYHSTNFQPCAPAGPVSDVVSDIAYQNNTLLVSHGAQYSFSYARVSFLYFEYGSWYSNINWSSWDPMEIAVIPGESSRYFVGTYGYGIYEGESWWDIKNNFFKNSYFDGYSTVDDADFYVYVSTLVADSSGNVYATVTPSSSGKRIYLYTKDRVWYSWYYPLVQTALFNCMIIDGNGYKWCGMNDGTVFIFDENETLGDISDDRTTSLYLKDASGEEIHTIASSLAIDNDDILWVGTGNGLAYYTGASSIFSDETPVLSRNKVEVDGVVDYLLATETINVICIDAANRKWVGTNTGVYLVSADGTEVLDHLTASNSALPSNYITAMRMIPEKSLLLIGTESGLVGYDIGIKTASSDLDDLVVYPNPVTHEHTGTITIENLMEDTNVKIIDINGNLVHEAVSEGGISYWDGNNLEGKRVATGVYLVICTSEDNSKKNVAKLVFVN